ncbi:hypothetical protein FSARC_8370 [Fusarium sarcochroum]|uniref:SnoaL-like domain-containing protein n=1 Tax=Fusarium sarcochroum TaxID=1208366 RepID=A0A8H4TT09_9HYPO|nr:hypothetical protein FSARC_8370 [Fusarium sarcochroum]
MTAIQQPGSIERAIALASINATVHRYAYLARDNLDWDAFVKTLHPEARFHLPNGATVSSAEWKHIVLNDQAKYIRHHLTTIVIDFTKDTVAQASAQFLTVTDWSTCDHWGEWQFTLAPDADKGWLISELKIQLEGTDPKGWAASKYKHGESK